MYEYAANNPSEMLNLLFDGELDITMETQLYASLLASEDLRTELRELITMREAVHKDTEAYALPAVATQNIFSKLGYSNTDSIASTTITKNIASSPWYKKLWNPVVSAILASILTALFFLNFNNAVNTRQKFAGSKTNKVTGNTVQSNITPIISQSLIKEKKSKSSNISKTNNIARANFISRHKNISIEKPYPSSIPITVDKNHGNVSSFFETHLANNNMFNLKNVRNNEKISNLTKVHQRKFQLTDSYYPALNKEHSLILCLNGISAVSFPNVNIESQSTLLSNISFGGFVPISKNFNIGLEVGQETFGQIFYNIENNRAVKYKQNPKLLWAGMGINYTFDNYMIPLANAQPFLHFTLASTKLGPFGKAVTGIQFVSDTGFGFNFGLEGSVLVYQNENRFYSTEKFGFIYGMFMRF